ncbi:MAG: UvrD-helicase domain-containing protein [Faecalibacterium sp.]|nr:UvrD-helicase domain-containing protein [Ruminococcus sp.]MCM1392011.1 UvrD-helicase domain-containing protein [Ruminococcus sp.]MCM1485729.1 UvrD-helicase domain-containing protein [Faecalibacterium sp.]
MVSGEFLTLRKKIIEKDFSRMNDMQKKAIFQVEGPLLILAGAGSGKTTVIVNRIANIVKYGNAYNSSNVAFEPTEQDVELMKQYLASGDDDLLFDIEDLLCDEPAKPWQILAITFTNKAANELKERLEKMLGEGAKEIWASTFHSCCARILRRNADRLGYSSSFTIYDTDDAKRLIKECQRQLGIKDSALSHKTILNEISRSKDCLITPDEYITQAGKDVRAQRIGQCFKMYQQELKKADAMDFDDMIVNTVKLLETCNDVREYYQRRFKYIMVDEYQDTNHAQFRLTQLLADGYRNICVVGDDDQSIYRFRGATIENIMNFEYQYKNATLIRLEQNYRSTQTILDVANEVISNNSKRKGKNLWTSNPVGDKVKIHTAADEHEESQYITDIISENVSSGDYKFSDHAVLYRMNAQSNSLEHSFVRAGIPYRIIGGFRFYERAEIRDAIAYLTVVNNPSDNIRLSRIINVPKRGIGDTTVNHAFEIASGLGVSVFEVISHADEYEALKRASGKLMEFAQMIQRLNEKVDTVHLDEIFKEILEEVGYINYLEADKEKGAERIENISELVTNLVTYEVENEEATLSGFLEEVALMTDIDNYNAQTDAVVMMTLHSAKGLEFPVVFIPGMEEGIFPGHQSMYSPEEVEEERRLAYVGITRAREKLFLCNAYMRMLFGSTSRNLPSRFITEIPGNLVEKSGNYGERTIFTRKRDDDDVKVSTGGTLAYSGSGYLSKQRKAATATPVSKPKPSTVSYNQGDTVVSKVFGQGVILSVKPMGNDSMLEIAFDSAGTKKLMANYAKLEKV